MTDWDKVGSGAVKGATIGGAIGSLIPGPGTAIGTGVGGLLGGAAAGLLGREDKQTPMQARQMELVDQLLSSLGGQGPYSNLFNVDEAGFQKSFVDPMKQKFQSQIAPQIQQSYIASGQQRGTGLDDTLTRAGVNMDQLLNQFYSQQQQGAMNRQSNAMNSVLGRGAGAPNTPTAGQAIGQGLGGYLSSDAFGKSIGDIVGSFTDRKGFENDLKDTYEPLGNKNQSYDYRTGRMS